MFNLNWQPGMTLEQIEKETILQAYRYFKANKAATARALDIAVRTLDEKLKKFETDEESVREQELRRKREREDFLNRQRYGTFAAKAPESPLEAGSRLGVQSTQDNAKEYALPLPVGKEVQSVSSEKSSRNRTAKSG